MNFDEYKKLGQPDKEEKSRLWDTAIGLQQVDGLKTSEYLIQTAKANIEGDITFDEVRDRLNEYYKVSVSRIEIENRTEEADKTSARIAEVLSEKTFVFSPAQYINIHKRIFEGFEFAGKIRHYNITKDEWVLHGKTVYYASADTIMATLDYDFQKERYFNYKSLNERESAQHIADFISSIWQIHPFCEGNTRATSVFAIKYMRTFGFDVNNDLFADNSWYFRNALVRANYNNIKDNVYADKKFLYRFFGNLLLGENSELKNKEMLANISNDSINRQNDSMNAQNDSINAQNDSIKKAERSLTAVYAQISRNRNITREEIRDALGIALTTVSRKISELKSLGIIERVGSNKAGSWQIIKPLK